MMTTSKTILVVDDDLDIIEFMRAMLEGAGYRVLAASTRQEIEQSVTSTPPDLVLLDLLLSGTDGRAVTRYLKSQETTARIPIIILSAHPHAESEAEAAGADGFLAKPFEMNDFLATVATATTV